MLWVTITVIIIIVTTRDRNWNVVQRGPAMDAGPFVATLKRPWLTRWAEA